MEFSFQVNKLFDLDEDGFALLESSKLNPRGNLQTSPFYHQQYTPSTKLGPDQQKLSEILDRVGEASSKAQGLKNIITNYTKFITSDENRLYIKADSSKVYGILKVGKRNLFYHDNKGGVKELKPLCVLDFYVHESCQRTGIGKALFELMLEKEGVEPRQIAYDKPSPKLIAFLKKHYTLQSFVAQNNNFVIFNAYWDASLSKYTRPQKNDDKNNSYKPLKNTTASQNNKETAPSHARTKSYMAKYYNDEDDNEYYKRRSNNTNQSNNNKYSEYAASENMVKPSSPAKRTGNQNYKMTREEQELIDIQNRLKITDDQISKTKSSISQLQAQQQNLNSSINQRRQKDFYGGAPWGTNENSFNYTPSTSYGNQYNYSNKKY